MGAAWPLVGREDVTRRLVDALGRATRRGWVVLVGRPGIGKTRLVNESLDRLDAAGVRVHRVFASQSTADIPFGAFAHLVPHEVATSDRLAVLRRTADWLVSGGGAGTAAGGRGPVVVSVDDAHRLDDASAGLVAHLARTSRLRLVLTVREGEPAADAVARLVADPEALRIDLEALSAGQVGEVLERVLDGRVDQSTVQAFAGLCEGNPLWLRELLTDAGRRGVLVSRSGWWRMQGPLVSATSLSEVVLARISGLDAQVGDVVAALGLSEPLGVAVLQELFPAEVLARADDQGLLAGVVDRRRQQVRLSHPLYGEVMAARLGPLRARRLRRRLADVVAATGMRRGGDLLRVARWRLDTGDHSDPELLTKAAHAAGGGNADALAERFARAALAAGAGFAARIALVEALRELGRAQEADTTVRVAAAEAVTPDERVQAATRHADLLLFSLRRPADAERALADAEAAAATPSQAGEVTMMRAHFAAAGGRYAHAADLIADVLTEPSLSAHVRNQSAFVAGFVGPWCGRTAWAVEVVEDALAQSSGRHGEDYAPDMNLRLVSAVARQAAWQFDAVESSFTTSEGAVLQRQDATYGHWIVWHRGVVQLARGRIRQARRLLEEATALLDDLYPKTSPLGQIEGAYTAPLSEAAALAGDVTAAENALARAEAGWPADVVLPYRASARVWTAVARGEVTAARGLAVDAADAAAEAGAYLLEAQLRHEVVRLGAPDGMVDRLAELVSIVDVPQAALYAEHAAGASAGDAAVLQRAADGFEHAGADLLAAEAWAHAAAAHRNNGRTVSALAADAHVRRLAQACEGACTPALTLAADLPLTARELEVATLAATGLSDRDIADRLVISERTVHTHLHRCYTKLGIHERGGLQGLLN